MKNLLISLCLILSVSLFSCNKEQMMIGQWEIYKLQKPNGQLIEKRKKYIIFSKDGSMHGGRIGKEPNKHGQWQYNKEGNKLIFQSESRNKDDGDYKIEKLSRNEMILLRGPMRIFMEKVNK